MAEPDRPKARILAFALAAIGLMTLGASIKWSLDLFGLLSFLGGEGTNWPNVVLIVVIANLVGAAPLIVGLVLVFRGGKLRRS